MSIVLFAIIGAHINAGAGYWICFGVYCLFRIFKVLCELGKKN